jgi:hypothetical protein
MTMRQPPFSYVIKLRQHLSCDWIAPPLGAQVAKGYDAAGTPITTITVRVSGQQELVNLLSEIHRQGVLILSAGYQTVSGVDLRFSTAPAAEGNS